MKKLVKMVSILILLSLFLGTITLIVLAENLPPLPPTGGGSSGGGGSSSNTYNPPVFETYTKPLHSSDGSTIGRLEGKDFNRVLLWAEKNGTVGNASYVLTITGESTQQLPDDCWLDVNFEEPDMAGLPKGMDRGLVLAVVNVTKYPNNWNNKPGTLKYTIKISDDSIKGLDPAETYYLVRSDGASYQVQNIDGAGTGSDPMTFDVNPPDDNGVFTIIEAVKPTPTPTPTPVISPSPSPTPVPESIGAMSVAMSLATFLLGAIVSVALMYLLFMRGKG